MFEILESRGFCPTWIDWIKKLVLGGSVGVTINGNDSKFFKTGKGLRQGDPISPMLFNLVGDVLTRMLDRAAKHGIIRGLLTDFTEEGIISLQYADDTILFSDHDEQHLKNLKGSLALFEQISGMRINFHKSEFIPINLDQNETHRAAHIIGCPVGAFPIKYLGVPLHYEKIKRVDIQPLVDKILKRIAGWRGKLLSHAAKLVLIKTCLASIPVYLLSFIKFPKWAIKILSSHMANCMWDDNEGNHKWHLANWESISMCKEFGGLGVPNLRDLNICLLGSWLKRYGLNEGKLWKQIIDSKYNTDKPNIFYSSTIGTSQFFKSLMWAARVAKMGFKWKIGDGKNVKFWEDNWLGSSSLAIQFWDIYTIVNEQGKTVQELWDGNELRCTFRRTVTQTQLHLWDEIVQLASTISYNGEQDEMIWTFNSNGQYSSQSLYKIVNFRGIKPVFRSAIWAIPIPPRVHFFLWLLTQNKVLTRDNVSKRKQIEDKNCLFCCERDFPTFVF